jgi:hypothetical protein
MVHIIIILIFIFNKIYYALTLLLISLLKALT